MHCLTHEETNMLREIWVRQFSRALGKVPPYIDAIFRVELVGVRNKSFEEAKTEILISADEILTELEKHRQKGNAEIIMKLKDYLLTWSKLEVEKEY